jgi:hypothetical protein
MFCEFLFLHHHPAAGQERHTRDDAPHLSERETCIRFYNLYTFCVYVFFIRDDRNTILLLCFVNDLTSVKI